MRALALALLLPLAACGGNDDTSDVSTAGSASTAGTAAESGATAGTAGATAEVVDGAVTITPVGEQMLYAQTAFTATAGTPLRVVFQNTATGAAMRHNVVILQPGTDVNAFGIAAASAADNDYVPADMMSQVVAYTPMSNPGQTVDATFTVPTTPGEYPFVCTFPGHYATMRGVMTVVAA